MLTAGQQANLDACQQCDGMGLIKSTSICRDLTEQLGRPIMPPIKSGRCPRGKHALLDAEAALIEVIDELWGPKKWAELHLMIDPTPAKLEAFILSLPCSDNCAAKFRVWVAGNPPDFTPAGWFRWTVRAHDAVNADPTVNHPPFGLEQAMRRWDRV